MNHRIPVFYVPEMVGKPAGSYSPSAGKPAEVVADWLAQPDIAERIEVVEFDSISRDVIAQAHDPKYVADVLARREDNGFGERSKSVADSLPFTSGSMLAACLHVLGDPDRWDARSRIACSPSSGFHHANYAFGGGFCTFNGLMVAAIELKRRRLVDRVLILDCDEHYGDGTEDIMGKLKLDWVTHVTHRGSAFGSYRNKAQMIEFISEWLPQFPGPRNLTIFQAGADCHVNDPLGGFLTTQDMQERDALVFKLVHLYRVPLVWNLAGGYQVESDGSIPKILELHRNTMKACIASEKLTRPFRLRFFAQGLEAWGLRQSIAELMVCGAVSIEAGRMQHKHIPATDDDSIFSSRVNRQLVAAVFPAVATHEGRLRGLIRRMADLGFTLLKADADVFDEWAPVTLGAGLVPLSFYSPPLTSRNVDSAASRIGLLMKFLHVRFELALRRVAARPGWHVTTFHSSSADADRLRQLFEKKAPELQFEEGEA